MTNFSLDDDCKCCVDGVIINKVTVGNLQRTVTRILGWWFGEYEAVRGIEFWQAVQRHLWRTTRVIRRLACISDRRVASSSVHSIYKNQHPSSDFLAFHRKYIVRASLSPVRDPSVQLSSQNLIRSLFSSVSDSIRSICFYFSFYSPFGKNLSFLHPSPLFFKPVSLRFCYYV